VNSGNSSAVLLNAITIVPKAALKTLTPSVAATPAAEPATHPGTTDTGGATAKKKKS
jgi:hypothetical protein